METLITFAALQIPVAIFAYKGFKCWSKAKTLEMHKRFGGEGRNGIAVQRFGITLYYAPYNAKSLEVL